MEAEKNNVVVGYRKHKIIVQENVFEKSQMMFRRLVLQHAIINSVW